MSDPPPIEDQNGSRPEEGSWTPPLPPAPVTDGHAQAPVTEEGATSPRRGRTIGVIALLIVLVLGTAGASAFFMLRGSGEELLGMVPGDADVVAVAYLDPSAGQKVNLLRMADKFPDLGTGQDLQQRVADLLDQVFQGSGMTHDDVAWVGVEVAIAVDVRRGQFPSVAVLVDSNDDEAARAALQKVATSAGVATHTVQGGGVEITVGDGPGGAYAIVDGTVVIGSDQVAVENVIRTANGDAPGIQENVAFNDATAGLPAGRLGLAFVNVRQLVSPFGGKLDAAFAGTGAANVGAIEGIGLSLSAESDGMAMDVVAAVDEALLTPEQRVAASAPDHPNPMLAIVPSGAYGVYAFEHLDTTLTSAMDQLAQQDPGTAQQLEKLGLTGPGGLLSQLSGDVAFQVGPAAGAPLGGTVLIGTNDPQATAAAITDLLGRLPLGSQRVEAEPRWRRTDYKGVTITYLPSGAGTSLAWAIVGDAAVLGSSVAEVQGAVDLSGDGGGIDQAPGFTAATSAVPSGDGVLYVDVQAALTGIRAQLDPSAQASFDEQIKNLAPISTVVMGFSNDASSQHIRVLVRIP